MVKEYHFKLIYWLYYTEIPSSTALLDITLSEIQKKSGELLGTWIFF